MRSGTLCATRTTVVSVKSQVQSSKSKVCEAATESREAFGVRRIPALLYTAPGPIPKRRNAAHSKHFATKLNYSAMLSSRLEPGFLKI